MSAAAPSSPTGLTNPAAEDFKAKGNVAFKESRFFDAIALYTQSIEIEPSPVVLCNRAFANLRVMFSGDAINDADAALALDASFAKAYYRKATAFLQLGKLKEALREFKLVVAMCPDDADAQSKLRETEKEYRKVQFLNAIASGEKPVSQRIDVQAISIPDSYTGPRLPEGTTGITVEFVMAMIDCFKAQKLVAKRYAALVLTQVLALFKSTPNVVMVPLADEEVITVCGDTHGQFYDLLNIFAINGFPSTTNRYLFNGDFVDRGSYSVENVITLLAFKVLYPNHFFMSRGNHEAQGLNRVYGFEGEVNAKYDGEIFDLFQEVFNALPLAHVLNSKVFVTHGGLFSQDNVTIDDLQKVYRFCDIPEKGHMCELLWADPQHMSGRSPSKRGVGLSFGPDVTANFLATNNLSLVVRSHEVQEQGFQKMHGDRLITVFSAPNYCDQMGNKGAFIRFTGRDMQPVITSFSHVDHPGKRAMAYSSLGFMGGM